MELSIPVLVVEDEHLIHALLTEALTEGGFAVAIAADGEEAMRMLNAPDASYRALVTDVNLSPGKLTGWDVAKRARELLADIPVVYMSGAGSHDWPSRGVPNSVLVPKPFAPAQIVTAVSQLLNRGNTPSS
jgi:DNA-binding response OmpR family regulator